MAFNLTRAVGVLADRFHAKAVTATIRADSINAAARVTRSAGVPSHDYPPAGHGPPPATAVHSGDRPTPNDLTSDHQPHGLKQKQKWTHPDQLDNTTLPKHRRHKTKINYWP
jgi:hypothetical protein